MTTEDLRALGEQFIRLVRGAGELVMGVYGQDAPFRVHTKDDESPVTRADWISSEYLVRELSAILPEALVISEENDMIPYEQRKTYEYVVLVDPLDGTKEFLKKNGEFCINIALVRGTQPVLGVLGAPVRDEVYLGFESGGAWWIDSEGGRHRIQADTFEMEDDGVRFITSRSHMDEQTVAYIDRFSEARVIKMGSALKFSEIALGHADIYPKKGRTMEWDTAAGQIILEEAGGSVVHFDTGLPLSYNKQKLSNPNFLALGHTKTPTHA
jgi:3'(2'), 5'-bisphosphate nucleotidase